ncbi:cytochrome b/b6 domain-containing protein [Qipengyuania sp. ASV99]|uniref:cytochrome b/b6 domain-containing protein n=1 Tax=Qipengyuania sp. ASV99 TaxID=3399681 RepID=UPI003A4C5B6E
MAIRTHSVKIWDLPVRVTHWSFAILAPAMWITAENDAWAWHTRLGHVLLALLIFRVIWGFIGTETARFSRFVKGPGKVLSYLRGDYDEKREIGHSPLGALSVLGLLSVIGAQVSMGLFAGDPYDGATGPLNSLVSVSTADMITETHEWFVYAVFAMIGLHITAIALYAGLRMQNLVGPMVVGQGEKAQGVTGNSSASARNFLIAAVLAVGIALWIWFGAPPLT